MRRDGTAGAAAFASRPIGLDLEARGYPDLEGFRDETHLLGLVHQRPACDEYHS